MNISLRLPQFTITPSLHLFYNVIIIIIKQPKGSHFKYAAGIRRYYYKNTLHI